MAEAEKTTMLWVNRVEAAYQVKASRAAEQIARRKNLKASDYWAVGDVLYNSWGYEQTNIDWYQVVEVKAKSILIRPIHKNYKETAYLQGVSQPRRNDWNGVVHLKPLDEHGNISMYHGSATKWDGKPVHESHYH